MTFLVYLLGVLSGLYIAAGILWLVLLKARNPDKPTLAIALLAVVWPYCEMKADR